MKLKRLAASVAAGIFAVSAIFFNSGLVIANADDTTTGTSVYVLMNIPYDDFYKAEIGSSNTVKVDGVSSATLNKTRTGTLTSGSYHVDNSGKSIDGTTFYVKASQADLDTLVKNGATIVTDSSSVTITVTNRGKTSETTYEGKEALYEAPSYSYYVLTETPSYYKELTLSSDKTATFSEIKGTYETAATLKAGTDITYTFTNDTTYGDFELDFDTAENANVLAGLFTYSGDIDTLDDIYGVIITTDEGGKYALRHLENIWRGTKLAWSAGVVTVCHGCTLSYEHYKAMVGQTITGVTYLTSKGKIEITDLNEKVELMEFDPMTDEQKTKLTELNATMTELLANYDRTTATDAEKDLYDHMKETRSLLNSQKASVTAANELIEELPAKIKAVQDERSAADTTDTTEQTDATETTETTGSESAQTADNSYAALYAAAALAALLSGVAVLCRRREDA